MSMSRDTSSDLTRHIQINWQGSHYEPDCRADDALEPSGQTLPDVVLLDFTAGYCQPCQQMVPVLQRMKRDQFPIRAIDISQQPNLSRQYNVERIPTFIVLVEGQEVRRFQGLTAEKKLRDAMNDAARKLDNDRKQQAAASGMVEQAVADGDSPESAEETPRSGIRGFFDRVRQGLGGGDAGQKDSLEHPDFRAQSPEVETDRQNYDDSLPMRATVRVRLNDGRFRDVGTGTIVHSTTGQSTILTCGPYV